MVLTWPMTLDDVGQNGASFQTCATKRVLTRSGSHQKKVQHRKQWLANCVPIDFSGGSPMVRHGCRFHCAQATHRPASLSCPGGTSCWIYLETSPSCSLVRKPRCLEGSEIGIFKGRPRTFMQRWTIPRVTASKVWMVKVADLCLLSVKTLESFSSSRAPELPNDIFQSSIGTTNIILTPPH